MCNPALAVGVASTLGGTYLKNQAANRADRLAQSAENRFNQSNVALETEGRDAVNKTGSSFERSAFDAGTGMETERLANLFNNTTTIPQRTLPIASGVPAVIGKRWTQRLHGPLRSTNGKALRLRICKALATSWRTASTRKWPIAQTLSA